MSLEIKYDEIYAQIHSCQQCCIWKNSTTVEKDCNDIFTQRIPSPVMNFDCSHPQKNPLGFSFRNAQIMFCEKRLTSSYIIGESISGGVQQQQNQYVLFIALTLVVLNISFFRRN